VALASFGRDSIAVLRISPETEVVSAAVASAAAIPSQPSFVAVRLRRDGQPEIVPVPWLAPPARVASDPTAAVVATDEDPTFSLERVGPDALVLVADGFAWIADLGLRPQSGPFALPSSDARITATNADDAVAGWSASPFSEGRSSTPYARREVFVGRLPRGGASVVDDRRVTRGRAALAIERRDEGIGVLFESAGRVLFAEIDVAGTKRGGDVVVTASPNRLESEYGRPRTDAAHTILARGGGRYTTVSLGASGLVTTGVSCAR
jgi:hypothetical protein